MRVKLILPALTEARSPKFEPLWDWLIRLRRVGRTLPVLEAVLSGFGEARAATAPSASCE